MKLQSSTTSQAGWVGPLGLVGCRGCDPLGYFNGYYHCHGGDPVDDQTHLMNEEKAKRFRQINYVSIPTEMIHTFVKRVLINYIPPNGCYDFGVHEAFLQAYPMEDIPLAASISDIPELQY